MRLARHFCGCMDQRSIVIIMVFIGIVISHIIRNSLSMGILDIVIQEPYLYTPEFMMCENHAEEMETTTSSFRKNVVTPSKATVPYETNSSRFYMSESQIGRVFGAFYIGYLMGHVPGVVYSDVFGPRNVMGIGVFISSICCFLIPPIAEEYLGLYFIRLIMGFSQGLVFPASNCLLERWIPPIERQPTVYLVLLSTPLGAIICFLISGLLLAAVGYVFVFIFWGILGIVWVLIFFCCIYNDRFTHQFITIREKAYLDRVFMMVPPKKKSFKAPVCSMLKSLPVWAYLICVFGHNYLLFTMLNFHPRYIKTAFLTTFSKTGGISALPYIFMLFIGILSEITMNVLYEYYYLTHDTIRRFSGVISQVGPGFACATAIFYACKRKFSVLMTCVGMGLMGPFWSATKYSAVDLTPNYAGFLVTVIHSLGVIAGWVSGRVYSATVRRPAIFEEWERVFLIANIIITFSGIFFGFFMRTRVQKWNSK